MEIVLRENGDIKIVAITGNLDTNTAAEFEKALNGVLDEGVQKLLINFESMEYISSAGLRVLLTLAKKMTSTGGSLKLCSLNETAQEVFDMSGFSTIFQIHKTEEEAITNY